MQATCVNTHQVERVWATKLKFVKTVLGQNQNLPNCLLWAMACYHGNHADDELSNLPTVSLNVHQSPEWALHTEGSVPYKSRQTETEDTSHSMTMIKRTLYKLVYTNLLPPIL